MYRGNIELLFTDLERKKQYLDFKYGGGFYLLQLALKVRARSGAKYSTEGHLHWDQST